MNLAGKLGVMVFVLLLGSMVFPESGLAHPRIDQAIELYELAEFERARESLEEAASSENLTREELTQLLSTQALVFYALRDQSRRDRALEQLVVVHGPNFDWGPATAPEFVQAFQTFAESPGESPELEVSVTAEDARLTLTTSMTDETELIQSVLLSARSPGGAWEQSADGSLTVRPSGDRIEYFAIGLGPGGVSLVGRGTEETPLVHRLEPNATPLSAPVPIADDTDRGRSEELVRQEEGLSPIPFIVLGTVLAAGLGVALYFLLRPADQATLTGPNIDWTTGG